MEDDAGMFSDPLATLKRMRVLGVQEVRIPVRWQLIAPSPNSTRRPSGFNAANPAEKKYNWGIFDVIDEAAAQTGIKLDFDVMGGAPRWAAGGPAPSAGSSSPQRPSPSQFALFVRAVGLRYSGKFTPAGASAPLPRITTWSVWNEPNYGPSLSPQGVPGHLSIDYAPQQYRNLLDAAWGALQGTGHAHDTIMFGELADRGRSTWGFNGGMTPGVFMRSLYCVGTSYRPLSGTAARERGCPATASASRRFRAQHPALFSATGVSDHPYMRWYAPNHEPNPDPYYHMSTADYSSLGTLGTFERILDRLQRAYGSHRSLPIYDTEFGYITNPPKKRWAHDKNPYVSQATAASFINQAEYISWHSGRVASYMQYELQDPFPALASNDYGNFASGLINYNGTAKPGLAAFRLPLYLPVTSARRGSNLEVWGCIRPAAVATAMGAGRQTAQVEIASGSKPSGRAFRKVASVSPSRGCYFDTRLRLPGSGVETVRLAWRYPSSDPQGIFGASAGQTVYSRWVTIRLK
jgi:hypothetical protein